MFDSEITDRDKFDALHLPCLEVLVPEHLEGVLLWVLESNLHGKAGSSVHSDTGTGQPDLHSNLIVNICILVWIEYISAFDSFGEVCCVGLVKSSHIVRVPFVILLYLLVYFLEEYYPILCFLDIDYFFSECIIRCVRVLFKSLLNEEFLLLLLLKFIKIVEITNKNAHISAPLHSILLKL